MTGWSDDVVDAIGEDGMEDTLVAFLDGLRALGDGPVPEPDPELAALLAGAVPLRVPPGRASSRPAWRRLAAAAAAVVIVASGAAVQHELPGPAQHLVSNLVDRLVPFHFDLPRQHPSPASAPKPAAPVRHETQPTAMTRLPTKSAAPKPAVNVAMHQHPRADLSVRRGVMSPPSTDKFSRHQWQPRSAGRHWHLSAYHERYARHWATWSARRENLHWRGGHWSHQRSYGYDGHLSVRLVGMTPRHTDNFGGGHAWGSRQRGHRHW